MDLIKRVILTAYLNEIADNEKAKAIGRGATYEGVKERTCSTVADAWQRLQDALFDYRKACVVFSNGDRVDFDQFNISAPNNTVMQQLEKKEGKYEGH